MSVFIGPSIWRDINVRTMSSLMTAIANAPQTEEVIWAPIWNDALLGRSRSVMVSEFLKTDCDVMVIIDQDIVFEPDDMWKIVEGARATESLYGAAYVTRSTEPHITSRVMPGVQEQIFAATPERRPVEYQYLATGFWAMPRAMVEAMVGAQFVDAYGTHKIEEVELGADRPFTPFFSPFVCREEDGRLHYLSEDWAFSNRIRQIGYKIWVDLSIILLHMGEYPYSVRDLETLKEPGLPSTGIDVVKVNVQHEDNPEPLLATLVEDIAEWADEDLGDIRRRMPYGFDYLSNLWGQRGDQPEEDWYKLEEVGLAYVLDLANWHLKGNGAPLSVAADLAGKSVLDYGCGIGTFALAAARAGAHVTTYEPHETQRKFMRFRATKHDIDINSHEQEPTFGKYDVVVCWHVFEHVEYPGELLRKLRGFLKPGGMLISQSGFHDQSTPMHHADHSDHGWDYVLKSHGFERTMTPDVYQLVEVVEAVPA